MDDKTRLVVAVVDLTKNFIKDVILPTLTKIGVKISVAVSGIIAMAITGVGIILAVVEVVFSVQDYLNSVNELKKARNLCYGMYKRIKLLMSIDTNKLTYRQIDNIITTAQNNLNVLYNEVLNNDKNLYEMSKKYFIPADFNSFVLSTNILSWIDTNQTLMTIRNGSIADYVTFVSIQDYIDTHEIYLKDTIRIKSYIFDNNIDMLNIFAINLEYLKSELLIRKSKTDLTNFTRKDVNYLYEKTEELLSLFTQDLLDNLRTQNNALSPDVDSLFSSVYRYLDYGFAMQNSPLASFENLIKVYYPTLDVEEYCKNFPKYPIYLFEKYLLYFGNVIYNDIYLLNYKKQIDNLYNQNSSIYSQELILQINYFFQNCIELENKFLNMLFVKDFINKVLNDTNTELIEKYNKIYVDTITVAGPEKIGLPKENITVELEKPELISIDKNFIYTATKDIINNTLKNNDLKLNIQNLPDSLYYGKSHVIKFSGEQFLIDYAPFPAALSYKFGQAMVGGYKMNKSAIGDSTEDYLFKFDVNNITYKNNELWKNTKGNSAISIYTYDNDYKNYANTLINNINYYNSVPIYRAYNLKTDVIDFIKNYPTYDSYFYSVVTQKWGFLSAMLVFVNNWWAKGDGMTDWEKRFRSALFYPEWNDGWQSFIKNPRGYNLYGQNVYNKLRDFMPNMDRQPAIDFFNPWKFWNERKQIYDKIQEDLTNIENLKNEYSYQLLEPEFANPEYNAILSQVMVTKDNAYIFNLFKSAVDLIKSNIGFYMKTPDIAFSAFNIVNDKLTITSYANIYEVLTTAYKRTNYLNMFYLLNKNSLDKLFGYADENFKNKISMYDYYKQITPEYDDLIISYQKAVDDIKNNFYETINSVTTDSILQSMENEFIDKQISENEKILQQKKVVEKNNEISYNKVDNRVNKILQYSFFVLGFSYLLSRKNRKGVK